MAHTVQTPDPDDDPMVRAGIKAVLVAADATDTRTIDPERAASLLVRWDRWAELTIAQFAAVVRRFPGPTPMPGGGWISGPAIGP